jgi:hypothetical protein
MVVALMLAAVALAHTANVSVACVQGGKFSGTFTFQNFPQGSGADVTLWVDGVPVRFDRATGLGSSQQTRTFTADIPSDGKPHSISASVRWTADGGGSAVSQNVTCSGPTPTPTPTPSPTPTPTPTPSPTPTPPPIPTPTPTPPPKPPEPPKKPCPDTSANRYSITVTPQHATHGRVTFRLNGPHVRKVRWYVDLKRRGTTNHRWETLGGNADRLYSVWLFSTTVWGKSLWGWHWVTVRAVVGPKGCGHSVSKKLKYFNNDPPIT